jgi:hypothetical protein
LDSDESLLFSHIPSVLDEVDEHYRYGNDDRRVGYIHFVVEPGGRDDEDYFEGIPHER